MNRFTKQLTVVASLLLLTTFPALTKAQSTAPEATQEQAMPGQQEERGGRLADLNLSEDQRAQIKQIHEGAKSRVDAVKNDSSLSADQKEAKIHEIRHESHEQVKKILTPEQRKHERMRRHHDSRQQQQAPPSR